MKHYIMALFITKSLTIPILKLIAGYILLTHNMKTLVLCIYFYIGHSTGSFLHFRRYEKLKDVLHSGIVSAYFKKAGHNYPFTTNGSKYVEIGDVFSSFKGLRIEAYDLYIVGYGNHLSKELTLKILEPFLLLAIIGGILSAFSTIISVNIFGVEGVVFGYVSIIIFVSFPLSFYMFNSN